MSWIGSSGTSASFLLLSSSSNTKFRWQQLPLVTTRVTCLTSKWARLKVFFPPFLPPRSTHNALLYLVLASRFISQRSQVFLAAPARHCSQRGIHCSPSAEEGHAEPLLLLSRHRSPESCFFFLVPVLIISELFVFNGQILLRPLFP